MKTEGVMTGGTGVVGRALALMVLVCGLTADAQQAPVAQVARVKTAARTGAISDTVVASVVDTGIRTGATVTVTLRLRDSAGAVLAQTTGAVNEGLPLRLSYKATTANGIFAEVVFPIGSAMLSAPVVTLERWNRLAAPPPPPPPPPPAVCPTYISRPDEDDEPVTLCFTAPDCVCKVEPLLPQ
ncbi:hypothetical protein [Pyxidicoccus xibeiensis]|uniref:hypothetical protein n=1 Tax=Pyxidicoccus xibeiensis TaxID=2906759 RepID=UPI0020A8123D|nr:hypothetical protein [Pyxidicoccus xibeiensis]MCP3138732.1 hypothetical protein [Pyxidicoccus xibeiensis]